MAYIAFPGSFLTIFRRLLVYIAFRLILVVHHIRASLEKKTRCGGVFMLVLDMWMAMLIELFYKSLKLSKGIYNSHLFLAATKQLYDWFSPSVRLSVCLSVRHTFFTMFPSSYHHEIFRSYYQWQKWRPCKRSRSGVKGQGHRGQHPS